MLIRLCPICYDEITVATGEVRMSCSHTFHLNCIGTWLQAGRDNCPCCRRVVQATERLAAPVVAAEAAAIDNLIPISRFENENQSRNITFINRDYLTARHPDFIFYYEPVDGSRVAIPNDPLNNNNNSDQIQVVANNIPIQ